LADEKELENAETKSEIEEKINQQIAKKKAKEDNKPSLILEYLKTEHKWETWFFLAISVIVLELGVLILTSVLTIRSSVPVIGDYPVAFGWVLVVLGAIGTLYALYPFFKPAFPEFKKITWLTGKKYWGNVIRTFLFIGIFVALFFLYDTFISSILTKIFG